MKADPETVILLLLGDITYVVNGTEGIEYDTVSESGKTSCLVVQGPFRLPRSCLPNTISNTSTKRFQVPGVPGIFYISKWLDLEALTEF